MTSMVQTLIYPSYKIVQWYILASMVFQFLLNSSAFMGVTNSLLHESGVLCSWTNTANQVPRITHAWCALIKKNTTTLFR